MKGEKCLHMVNQDNCNYTQWKLHILKTIGYKPIIICTNTLNNSFE